jgi:hypothetical protein
VLREHLPKHTSICLVLTGIDVQLCLVESQQARVAIGGRSTSAKIWRCSTQFHGGGIVSLGGRVLVVVGPDSPFLPSFTPISVVPSPTSANCSDPLCCI